MKKLLNIFLLLFAISFTVNAQQFKASVDKTTVGENERFQVYFEFEGGDYNKVQNFQGPAFKGLRKVGGPNQSQSMQIINGRVQSSITYSYVVVAPQKGTYTIESASLQYEGKTLSTNPIKINVVKAGSKQGGRKVGGISREELEKNCFIRAIPSKREAYLGEQIIVTYKLYTKLRVSGSKDSKAPVYSGFWSEELETGGSSGLKPEMFNGERYSTVVLSKVALFPNKVGTLTISPMEMLIPIVLNRRRSSNDYFDDFFNDPFFRRNETVDHWAKSKSLKIKVKELPAGKPASFNGVVGDFSFDAKINNTEVEVNEPVTVKINIKGTGNLKLLELPKPELPSGFEVYDPKYNENISRKNYVSGTKQIEYLIVPRVPGQKVIKPFEFSFFNPKTGKYESYSSDEFTINVKGSAGSFDAPSAGSGFSKEDIKLLSEDIRFIKTTVEPLEKRSGEVNIALWFWVMLVAPVIVLLITFGVIKRNEKLAGNVELIKSRKAEKQAKKRLKKAKKCLSDGNKDQFYTEVSSALNGYLEDKLNIQRADFTLDKAVVALSERNVDEDTITRVKAIFEKCEFARFAPGRDGMQAESDLYDETIRVIVKLENNISNRR